MCGYFIKQISLSFLVLYLALPIMAQEKSFIGGGVSIIRSSNYDPTPAPNDDGGKTFSGVYVEAGLSLPKQFQARLLAEYSKTPQLQTIFTTDEGSRKAKGEFRIRPELRFYFNPEAKLFIPFIAGGVDSFSHRFNDQQPQEERRSVYGEEYDYTYTASRLPSSGANPYITFGTGIGNNHEASLTRLFTEPTSLNPSEMSGYRINYSYTRSLTKRFSFKAGVEADYLRFRETDGQGYIDNYYEKDFVAKARIGFLFN